MSRREIQFLKSASPRVYNLIGLCVFMLVVFIVWPVKSRTPPLYSSRASPLLRGDLSRAQRAHSLWIKPNYRRASLQRVLGVYRNPHTVFVSTTNLLTTPHYNTTNTVAIIHCYQPVGRFNIHKYSDFDCNKWVTGRSLHVFRLLSEWRFYEKKLSRSDFPNLLKTV